MEDELFDVLLEMIKIKEYPSLPYDIYRYYTLLEDLDENRALVFNLDQKEETSFDTLSYAQISQLNFSQIIGTQPSRQTKKVIRMIDDEAIEVAQYLINKTCWSNPAIQSDMMDFIVNNAAGIHLYVRDITTIVYAIFVFLSLQRLSAPMKTQILFNLNQKIKETIRPPPDQKEPEEEVKDPEEDEEWVLWGKDNKHGQFLIIEKRKRKETSGTKCMNKRIPELKALLDKEGIREEYNEYFENKNFPKKRSQRKPMCEFLKQYLINNKRYYT